MSEFAGGLYGIEQFVPVGSNLDLLHQIELSLQQVNQARDEGPAGLPPEVVSKIEEDFLVDRIRHSATIEGGNLDRRETVHVLMTGQIIESKRRSSREIQNLGSALKLIAELIGPTPIDLETLLSVHGQLMEGLNEHPGRVRTTNIMLTGAKYQPPGAEKLHDQLTQLLETLQTAEQRYGGFTTGVYAHWALTRIHPFDDGNGRMARILQDWVFLRNRLIPVPISYALADEYYGALQEADEGRPQPFVEFVALAALKCLARYQAALDSKRETDDWIEDLAALASEKTQDQETGLYLRWSQRMAELRDTFSAVVQKLQAKLPMLKILMREYGGLDIQKFRQLRNQGKAASTWDFGLEFRDDARAFRFVFWHGVHWKQVDEVEILDDVPVLIVSTFQGEKYQMLKDIPGEKLSLREIALKEGELVRVRQDATQLSQSIPTFDTPITAQTICREFFQEVLKMRFNIG